MVFVNSSFELLAAEPIKTIYSVIPLTADHVSVTRVSIAVTTRLAGAFGGEQVPAWTVWTTELGAVGDVAADGPLAPPQAPTRIAETSASAPKVVRCILDHWATSVPTSVSRAMEGSTVTHAGQVNDHFVRRWLNLSRRAARPSAAREARKVDRRDTDDGCAALSSKGPKQWTLPSRMADRAHYRRHGIVNVHTKRKRKYANVGTSPRGRQEPYGGGKAPTAAARRLWRRKHVYRPDNRIADVLNTSANERDRNTAQSTRPRREQHFARRAQRISRLAEQKYRSVNTSANSPDGTTARIIHSLCWKSRSGSPLYRTRRRGRGPRFLVGFSLT